MGLSRAAGAPAPERTGSSAGHVGGGRWAGAASLPPGAAAGRGTPSGVGAWARLRRGGRAVRNAVLDAAALGGRLAAAWIAAAWALGEVEDGTRADVLLAGAVLACAAAFAVGLAAPLAGTLLAAAGALAALAPVPLSAGAAAPAGAVPVAAAGAAPWWLALAAVCLLGALVPGRLSADALVACRRRGGARARARGSQAWHSGQRRIGRRPEEAPPLPYPGGGAALTRPSRI